MDQSEIQRPVSLDFNLTSLQPGVQPSPVQGVISILEQHLAEQDKKRSQDDNHKDPLIKITKFTFLEDGPKQNNESIPTQITNLNMMQNVEDKKKSLEDESKQNEPLENIPTHITTLNMMQTVEGSDKNANSSQSMYTSLKTKTKTKDETNSFTCAIVNKNGMPDYSKIMKLDPNIIKEVFEKHGIEMKDMSGKSNSSHHKKKKKKKSKTEEKITKRKKIPEEDKTLKCTKCDKSFHRPKNLREHMRYHDDRKFNCRLCGYTTVRKQELEYHINSHTGNKPFTCDICQKGFGHPAVLVSHTKSHRGKEGPVNCKICKTQFSQPHLLDKHMMSHDESRPHVCKFCMNDFKRQQDLRNHIRLYHTDVPLDEVAPRGRPKTIGDFKCDQCERSFATGSGLEQHQRRTHKSRQVMEWTEEEDMMFKCDQCSKVFDNIRTFNKHKLRHSNLRPYTCTICGRSFKRQWELHKHKVTHNKDAPLLLCTRCDGKFDGSENLRRHIARQHSEAVKKPVEKPFKCETCNRAYSRQSELNEHQAIHTGARPYVCDQCGKTFTFRSSLACHRKLHGDTIQCDICGKRFGSKKRMQEHRVVHTGEKPYECQHCGTKYRYPSNLRWHLNNGGFSKGTCGKVRKTQGNKVKKTKASGKPSTQPDEPPPQLDTPASQPDTLSQPDAPPQPNASSEPKAPTQLYAAPHPIDATPQTNASSQQQTIQLIELQPPLQTSSLIDSTGVDQSQNGNDTQTVPVHMQVLPGTNQEGLVTVAKIVLAIPVANKIVQAKDGGYVLENPPQINQLQTLTKL